MRLQNTFVLVVLSFVLMGCHSASITAGSESLWVELWVSDECPSPSDVVTIRATVTNNGVDMWASELNDRPVFDIVIGNPDTSQIRWSSSKALTPDLTMLTLHHGESKSIEMQQRIDSSQSGLVVTAQLIDARAPNNPIQPLIVLHVNSCPGFLGP